MSQVSVQTLDQSLFLRAKISSRFNKQDNSLLLALLLVVSALVWSDLTIIEQLPVGTTLLCVSLLYFHSKILEQTLLIDRKTGVLTLRNVTWAGNSFERHISLVSSALQIFNHFIFVHNHFYLFIGLSV
jgi:hypothetical protein